MRMARRSLRELANLIQLSTTPPYTTSADGEKLLSLSGMRTAMAASSSLNMVLYTSIWESYGTLISPFWPIFEYGIGP